MPEDHFEDLISRKYHGKINKFDHPQNINQYDS